MKKRSTPSMPTPTSQAPVVTAPDLSSRSIAYFSMEIALAKALPTYSGGLGMLAGDTLRSAADTGAPMVAVSLVHRRGYFKQFLDANGQQTETDVPWSPDTLPTAGETVSITMQGRTIKICAWRFDVVGVAGHIIPVFLLDTDVEGNDPFDRRLTDHLYGGDTYYRLCQETVLGLGGVTLLHKLGCEPAVYHMNEGHAALLALGLLEDRLAPGAALSTATENDRLAVARQCVFTTHTPVPAGHDQFGLDQMYAILGQERGKALERFGCLHNNLLNMTYVALRFSRWVNGVAMQHGKVSQQMFPDYHVESVTNGVHAATWIGPELQNVLDEEIPRWRHDNQYFRSVYGIKPARIANAHACNKRKLVEEIAARTGEHFDQNVLTLGFARRVATYKRASLLLEDPKRLLKIAQKIGGLQIVFAGKAHPADAAGKGLIREVFEIAGKIKSNSLRIVYLENYDWELGATLTQGVDVWVNTPRRPYEASGTSGMKAALNGVPSLSILDGWWIEGCAEDVTGWAIDDGDTDAAEATSLYDKLEQRIAPLFAKPNSWARMMQHCIAMNGSFFNTDRMLGQYFANAYFPQAPAADATPETESEAEGMAISTSPKLQEPALV
ncbi:alpha-glucan family phosphorylase [Granulicella tundricola]|uniref:glycogen phosphorylase n=1 Tax=Granulicella tundricola (strain ATCC BAA-1859 / DSM 23138 / MP5ACTX9) TaxID=1198114 RepID=E8WWQ4_GRATM|nr:alpha-glucan family phosphorylase [Granulicella tundricola]ADW67382.1 alpha-glucan phosphorylase [Granulicella tundricola MP5ACTX9]